jgi:hypothetical protein
MKQGIRGAVGGIVVVSAVVLMAGCGQTNSGTAAARACLDGKVPQIMKDITTLKSSAPDKASSVQADLDALVAKFNKNGAFNDSAARSFCQDVKDLSLTSDEYVHGL